MSWSNTPPSSAGRYRAKHRKCGTVVDAEFDGEWWFGVGKYGKSLRTKEAAELVQFGHRIPTNDELAELPGLIEEYADACMDRAWTVGTVAWKDANQSSITILAKINAILGVPNDNSN